MTTFSDAERVAIRAATVNALAHVSDADPGGPIALLKEGRAGHKALLELPEPLRDAVLGDFELPNNFMWDERDDLEALLQRAVAIIAAKAPELRDDYSRVVVSAAEHIAGAAHGISSQESAVLERIRAALSTTPG